MKEFWTPILSNSETIGSKICVPIVSEFDNTGYFTASSFEMSTSGVSCLGVDIRGNGIRDVVIWDIDFCKIDIRYVGIRVKEFGILDCNRRRYVAALESLGIM